MHTQRATFETNRLGLCRRTGFGAGTEVGVVTHVAKHAAVAGVQTADRGPTRFSGLVALIGGRCFADAFVDEHQVLRLFAELRHGGFAVVDIRLTHRNRGGGIDLVVETVVVLQREIVAHFVEESVEREELGQVFAGRFTTETSKSQIVTLGLAAVDGLLTELGKEIAEERRFVTELHIVEPQLPIHACAIAQIHVEPSLVTIESVEELLRRIETTHTRTALPHGNVRPQVVRTLEAARKVEELLVVVARFVHHGPEVTSVVAPGAFDPLRVTERGANRTDEGAVGESIETGRVGAEHETIETIGELLRFEEVLLDFVHPVPFAQHTGDAFILSVVVPVAVTLLLLDTAQAETVDGVFGLQANHVVGEESVGFEVFEVVPILVLHLRRIKITIGTPAFHVNRDLRLLGVFEVRVVHHVIDVQVRRIVGINHIEPLVKRNELIARCVFSLHQFGIERTTGRCLLAHKHQRQFLFGDRDTGGVRELRVLSEARGHQFIVAGPLLRMAVGLVGLDTEIFLISVGLGVRSVPRIGSHAHGHVDE